MIQQLMMWCQESKGPTVRVKFVIPKSLHERYHDQLIVRRQYILVLADSYY